MPPIIKNNTPSGRGRQKDRRGALVKDGFADFRRTRRSAHQNAADDRRPEKPVRQRHQSHVQPGVPVENVAEFVGDDALQFVAVQQFQRAEGDADGHLIARAAGREGVDAAFVVEHVNGGNGQTRSNRHFLHDIPQSFFVGIGGIVFNDPSAEQFRHGRAAAGEQVQFDRDNRG